jgi:hypothetical protein
MKKGILFSILMIISLGFSACTHMPAGEPSAEFIKTTLKIVGVAPVVIPSSPGPGKGVSCPVCGRYYETGPIQPGAGPFLEEVLLKEAMGIREWEVLPPNQLSGAKELVLSGLTGAPDPKVWQKVGQSLKADAVLAVSLFSFQGRIGRAYGVDRPASVSFDLHLIRVSDGAILWYGKFVETQKSLVENILDFPVLASQGFKWLTPEELAQWGIKHLFSDLKTLIRESR